MLHPSPLHVLASFTSLVLTSADDALWLLPFLVSPRLTFAARAVHALLFAAGLQIVVLVSWLLSLTGKQLARKTFGLISLDPSAELSAFAALVAWLFFLFLVGRKWWRERRRADNRARGYSVLDEDEEELIAVHGADGSGDRVEFSPGKVLLLSLLGALDELFYFPAVLVSQSFTAVDLSAGALLASALVVAIVALFLARCRTLLEWMDRVPTSAVVGVYAVSLTVLATRDIIRS